ncbi:MAG: FadR family transcriptional regulator [Spirochaetales bacterium]|jgi:GntR family transcriptional repressor for pyruvate dehydrogenase complex|nr:FadR family transcriptional regulator [Spirochaetales bacterium]
MIKKTSITQQVIEYIKENIAGSIWLVGEKMPSENELTRMLGVSRASVRIAIQQFIALGLLKSVHGRGTFVVSNDLSGFGKGVPALSGDDYLDKRQMLEFRRIVESETSYLAAERASGENIRQLRFLLEQMKQAVGRDDIENFVRYDMMFHEEISRASGNVFLENSIREVFRQKSESYKQINQYRGYKDGVYYHTLLLQAIEAKNSRKARKVMYDHLQKGIEDIDQENRSPSPVR